MNKLLLTALFATTVTVYASNPDTAAHHAAAYVTTGDAEIDGLKMSICEIPTDTVELTACHESAFPFDEVIK